jgi:cell division septal protein FtsQ
MANKKRSGGRKLRLPSFMETLKDAVLEKMAAALVIIIFIVIAVLLVIAFLHGSDYFRLKAVESRGFADQSKAVSVNTEILKSYKNRNLFDIDIGAISRYLASRYPDAKSVEIWRALPDKLAIRINFRKPVAMLGESKFYPVDDEGVVLFTIDAKAQSASLPVISGIEALYDGKPIRKMDSKNLKSALELLKEIKLSHFLDTYRLLSIDATNLSDMAFYLNDGLEIRIGFENYKNRLLKLKDTLRDTRLVKDKIKYIDLRFDGVTIGPK